ncbi:MAG: gliding motility-associated C-terminal domain-containing protein [Bacteroidota bacterium]
MKCIKYLLVCFFLFISAGSNILLAQDCFDPSDPAYGTPFCQFERIKANSEGTVEVDGIILGPYNCGDGIDNDGDGDVDCNDSGCPDCSSVPEICGDGIDNNGDGITDCEDPICANNPNFCESDCGNGVDDDGDGFYDYYDGDCVNSPDNPNDYIVNQPDCEVEPLGNVFDITEAWSSEVRTASARGLPAVADIDNDGVPEVVSFNDHTSTMHILNGQDGEIEVSKTYSNKASWSYTYPAVGDVDGDGFGEIFHVDKNGRVWAWDHELNKKWDTEFKQFSVYKNKGGRAPGLADFNLDGVPEVFYVNEIRNAQTGALLVKGSHGQSFAGYTAHNWQTELSGVPVAIDILPDSECAECSGLELVLGHIVYAVDIPGGKLVEVKNMNDEPTKIGYTGDYYPKDPSFYGGFNNQTFNTTAVADYDGDGFLDVVCSGATINEGGPGTVFLWNIAKQEVRAFTASVPACDIKNRDDSNAQNIIGSFKDITTTPDRNNTGINSCNCNTNEDCTWIRGIGSLNLANIDADPELECTFMSGSSLFALDNDWSLKWVNNDDYWESSSGVTGTAVFDFDGDGASEIIYRDEVHLWIVDGFTGQQLNTYDNVNFCSSMTHAEYPIVADVDSDGETELVVVCARDQNFYGQGPNTGGNNNQFGFIRTYKAANGNYWVPARSVWNQFSYFNVNINDDLSIPRIPQPHHLSFSQICNDPTISAPFSLNKFLNQSPRLSYCGTLVFPAPKLDFRGDSTRVTSPTCTDQEFQIRLFFENTGDEEVERPIPISFYSENPRLPYTDTEEDPHFSVMYVDIVGGLQPGDFVDTTLTVTGPRGEYTVYASLNDIGPYDSLNNKISNSAFYPLTKINGPIRECDDSPTIVSADINPPPFQAIARKLRDNRNCPGDVTNINTGEVQVLNYDSTTIQESDYNIVWTNVNTGDVVGTTAIVTGLDSGTYVVDIDYDNGVYFCEGIADTVRVERFEDWPDSEVVTIEMIQGVSSCAPGITDGQARVLINGASLSDTDYLIEWEDEQQAGVLALGDTAVNLQPILYKVTVTNLLTGCSETETIDMTLDLPEIDAVNKTDNTNCINPNGTITVQMVGSASSYDYMLIQMSPVQDTTFSKDPSFSDLDEGIYEVRAYDPSNDCGLYTSGEQIEIITTTAIDDITIEVAQEQTSCVFPYNGQLTAVTADPSQFAWTWYRGTVTTGPLAEVVATDFITPDTLSTNLTNVYTVVATDNFSGCTFTESITLTEDVVVPVIDPADVTILQHQTTCEPNGQVQVSVGGITVGYQFTLQQGSTVIETNSTGLFAGLEAGPYVVIAEDTATNCISDVSAVFQIENRITPFGTIALSQTPKTNCDPANPNGALSITVGGVTSGYDFKWFVGVDTASAVSPQPATAGQLSGLDAGNYVISIVSQSSGCDTLVYTSVADQSIDYLETITATKLDDQRYCTPGIFSGAIEAGLTASALGGTPDTANYTYYWYEGTKNDVRNGSATLIAGQNRSVLNGRDIGWYSVRAEKNDGSGCLAIDTAQVYIDDARDFPVAGINVSVIEQSSCDDTNQNGGLRGDVNGNTAGYEFTWYQLVGGVDTPITTNNPNAVVNGFSVDSIGVGTYILEVRNTETGCTGREQVYLGDNIIKGSEIRLNLVATAATLCSPPNGVAEVASINLSEDDGVTFTLTDILSNYTYQWYLGDDTTTPVVNPTATSARLENVEPGLYTVVANNINSSCSSVAYTIEVESQIQNNLNFTFAPTTQADCVNPDGSLTVTGITGATGPFTYQWYKGGDDTYPLAGETSSTLTNIRSDKYMVRITDTGTGCFKDSVYVLAPDASITPVPPAVLSTPPTAARTCDPTDYPTLGGEIAAEVEGTVRTNFFPGHADSDFFYYWFEGENVKYLNGSASPIDDISNFDIMTGAPTAANNQSTISGLAPGFYTVIVVDAFDFNNSGGALGCRSDPRTFEVVAESQSPLVATTVEQDTLCVGNSGKVEAIIEKRATDGTVFSGFTLIDATQNGSSFFPLPGAVTYNENDIAGPQTVIEIDLLQAGEYTFTFQDETTSCDTTITVDINDESVAPSLAIDNIQVNSHQTSCNPENGELEVIASITDGITNLADYSFYWHSAPVTLSADIDDAGATTYLGTGTVLSGLDSGTYYVYAISNITGCISSPISEEILYQVSETQITIVQNTSNVDCSGAAQGSITVEAYEQDGSGALATPAGSYSFNWFDENNIAVASTEVGNQSTISNLADGAYRVEVRNNNLDCETVIAYDTIRFEPILPEFTAASVSKQNVTTCHGDGSIEITEVLEDGVVIQSTDAAFSNYDFVWYQGDTTSVLAGETSSVLDDLLVDTYYVKITNSTTGGCQSSDFLQVILTDSIRAPFIYLDATTNFITCTGLNEGAITVRAEEWDGSVPSGAGYTYSWTMADGSALPASAVGGNTNALSNLEAGSYEVTVFNPESGCSETAIFNIGTQVVVPLLTMNKTADQSNCFPSNGAAEVASLTFQGIASSYSDYEFIWSVDDFTTSIAANDYGLDANRLAADGLAAGSYLVKAVNLATGCESLPVQVNIVDSTENVVVILDNISEPIVACDPSNDAEGSIEVEVLNNNDFITRWYQGAVITNPADSLSGFSNSLEIENLVPGTYTVWVQDTVTGCETTRSYTIEGVAIPLMVSTSVMPFTNCLSPNGQIAANVSGGSGNYSYEWLDSAGNVLTVGNNQNIITDIENGSYTVRVSDLSETDCEVVEAIGVVPDSRGNEVPLSVNNDFSVTNCDETRPNGQLTAVVEGEVSRYEFFWYQGDIVEGNPIAQGPTAGDLAPNTYSVVARDKVTGCISEPVTAEVVSEMEDFMLPTPTATLLSPVTRCENPDGSARVVLDSTMMNGTEVFEYLWYDEDGQEVFRSTKTNQVSELAVGEYFVSVTNLLTGCYSESTSITIPEDIRIPDFEIVTTPSTCFEPTGSAQLRFNENFKIVDIQWLTPEGYSNKFYLNDQVPGLYEVTVTDDKGCTFTKSATIESTIYAYNGISPNGDGENDKFIISCIENFENNIVRIYNRAGALVYEKERYDNLTTYFEGFGNRGLYIGGEKLPDGTYFYIIDKNNGDDPESGYLELMR